jgi:hypothetical protein
MRTKRITAIRKVQRDALRRLSLPTVFNEVLAAEEEDGLVGEWKNVLVLFIACTSRLLDEPINVLVKGESSSGKNRLVTGVLRLMPKSAVREITNTSERAWNYAKDDFRHRIVYLQERNESTAAMHEMRLLISEDKIVRLVAKRINGEWVTKRFVTRGPVACISTTTKARLKIDEETRHVSIYLDESLEQNRRILKAQVSKRKRLRLSERRVWWMVQHLLTKKSREVEIVLPSWFEMVAEQVYAEEVRVRRYFPAFVSACKAVSLIRCFQRDRGESE